MKKKENPIVLKACYLSANCLEGLAKSCIDFAREHPNSSFKATAIDASVNFRRLSNKITSPFVDRRTGTGTVPHE